MKHIPRYVWITGCVCALIFTSVICRGIWRSSTLELEFADTKLKLGTATDVLENHTNQLKNATIIIDKALTLLIEQDQGDVKLYKDIRKEMIPSKNYDEPINNLKDIKYWIYAGPDEEISYPKGRLWLGESVAIPGLSVPNNYSPENESAE